MDNTYAGDLKNFTRELPVHEGHTWLQVGRAKITYLPGGWLRIEIDTGRTSGEMEAEILSEEAAQQFIRWAAEKWG